jgi:hypothetical protein
VTSDPQALVKKFFNSPFKFAMARKLRDLGPEVCPYLEQALSEGTRDAATLRQCAAILLHFRNHTGVAYLLQDLAAAGDPPFSALQLANAGIEEALSPIAQLLAGDMMRALPYEGFVLVDAHKKLAPIPEELKLYLLGQVPEKLRSDLEQAMDK